MMEKGLFYDLYDRLREVNFRSYSPDKLSAYLHGYLTVYTMVRIYPWLEAEFGVLYDIHERAKKLPVGMRYWCRRKNFRQIFVPVTLRT